MLGAGAICAGLAVSSVDRYASDVEARVGRPVPVVVATRELPRGRVITHSTATMALAERQVPQRFVPPGALRSKASAIGLETAAALAAGDYVGAGQLRPARGPAPGASHGPADARLVEVGVAGARTMSGVVRAGALVDVLISTEGAVSGSRTFLAVQRVPVVGFEAGAPNSLGDKGAAADGVVTLRVSLRQAVLLTAADNFAREVRLVPRAAGDASRLGPVSVAASRLGR
jgi:pilus assembly protein CpaB